MGTKKTLLYFNYEIFPEHNLLIEAYTGTVTLELMKKAKGCVTLDPRYKPEFNVIADVRNLTFDGTTQEIADYINFTLKHGKIVGKRKSAVIFSTPNQHVYSDLYSRLNPETVHSVHHFQEIESALKWIDSIKTSTEIEHSLNDIKKKSFVLG